MESLRWCVARDVLYFALRSLNSLTRYLSPPMANIFRDNKLGFDAKSSSHCLGKTTFLKPLNETLKFIFLLVLYRTLPRCLNHFCQTDFVYRYYKVKIWSCMALRFTFTSSTFGWLRHVQFGFAFSGSEIPMQLCGIPCVGTVTLR